MESHNEVYVSLPLRAEFEKNYNLENHLVLK